MDEQASFEAHAVLAPRRARLTRLGLLLPVVALVATAWAGVSGDRSDQATAENPGSTAVAAQSLPVEGSTPAVPGVRPPQNPAQVLGLAVQRLDDIRPRRLGRDDVIAVAGWYVATAITDCPPLAAIYREGSLPEVRGDADEWAFCDRFGVLYASRPDLDESPPSAGLAAVAVTLVVGVVVPPELEVIGADATEVVVVGRFVEPGDGCRVRLGCRRELVVDHVAWTSGV
jgi:hypothetical protein